MIHRSCRNFVLFFVFSLLPAFLFSETLTLEPSGNTLNPVESSESEQPASSLLSMPEVVVTANRLHMPANQVASSLSVITQKDLEKKQTTTILNALQGMPGIDLIRNGGSGQVASAFIRGGNSEHTLVMMDGIPLNDPSSTTRVFDGLDNLMVDGVKQIEVVRGPQSPFFGTNAMGGVVNIVSREEKGPFKGSLLFEGGAYNTFREAVSADGGGEDYHFTFCASRLDSAGYPAADKAFGNTVNNGNQDTAGFLKLGFTPLSELESRVMASYGQSHTGLASGGGPGMDDPNYFSDGKRFLLGSQSTLTLFDGDWQQVLGISYTDNNRSYADVADPVYPNSMDQKGNYVGQAAQMCWQNNLRLAKGQILVLGLQGRQEWAQSHYASEGFYGPYVDDMTATSRTGSLFVESQSDQEGRFFQTLGARLDVHDGFGNHTSYHAGIAYFIPGPETKLKATYGTGFRAPSLYQLFNPLYGNGNLKPETSTGFDCGVEQPFGKDFLTLGATYFHNDFNELIDYDFSSWKYLNVGQAQSDGVEAFASFKGLADLDARLNYTYTDARNTVTQKPLSRRPQNKAGVDLFYHLGKADFGTSVSYVGGRRDVSFIDYVATDIVMPEYFLLNLMASYRLDDHFKFFGRVENLFNQTYEQVWGYGTPGFSLYFGTKITI
jgi:vitamin B12 transporter